MHEPDASSSSFLQQTEILSFQSDLHDIFPFLRHLLQSDISSMSEAAKARAAMKVNRTKWENFIKI